MFNQADATAVLIADRRSLLRGRTARRQPVPHAWTPPKIIEPAVIAVEERELATSGV